CGYGVGRGRDQASVGTKGGDRERSSAPQLLLERKCGRGQNPDRASFLGHGEEAPVRAERKRARGDVSRRTDARAGLCAPDAQAALDVVAEDERTVGAESRAFHRVRVIENVEGLPIRAEDPRGAVVARRQHEPPVTAEGRGTNRLPGSRKEAKLGRRARIPDARGSVGARRRYSPPAGAERGRDDRVGVAAE